MELDKEELKSIKSKIVECINHNSVPWTTVPRISAVTGIEEKKIKYVINTADAGDFARSIRKNEEGEDLISTKYAIREKGDFFQKLLGAFKNRID